MTLSRRNYGFAFAAVALALAVGGCGSGGSDQEVQVTSSPASPPGSTEEPIFTRFSTVEPIVGCTYDYQPMRGPRAMGRASDLVVRGTIGTPRPGLVAIRSDGSEGRVETDIVPIEVSSVLANGERLGANPAASSMPSLVEVEIDCAFPPPKREAKLASLEGRQAVAYLNKGPANRVKSFPGDVRYSNGAPRPRYQEASVEGFLIDLASGNGVRNLSLGEKFPGAELTDFYPQHPGFPPGKIP